MLRGTESPFASLEVEFRLDLSGLQLILGIFTLDLGRLVFIYSVILSTESTLDLSDLLRTLFCTLHSTAEALNPQLWTIEKTTIILPTTIESANMSLFIRDNNRPNLPVGYPDIPEEVSPRDLVAIIDIESSEAIEINQNSLFKIKEFRIESNDADLRGARIFLHHLAARSTYSFGAPNKGEDYDVYVPIKLSTKKLFELEFDGTAKMWRINATAKTIITADGVRIQKSQGPSRKTKDVIALPHSMLLDASKCITVTFDDRKRQIKLKLWLARPNDLLKAHESLRNKARSQRVQGVADRSRPLDINPSLSLLSRPHAALIAGTASSSGNAADELYIWNHSEAPVSNKSYRLTHRFTGEVKTAKIFQQHDAVENRDLEFLIFSKESVCSSLVRYKQTILVEGVPAVITDTHDSMTPFAAIEATLSEMHPGLRCKLASEMIRPLFSAIDWLHFHKVYHGSLTPASVLLQIVDDKIVKLLLVDYSGVYLTDAGDSMSEKVIHSEGVQAMDIIATCSNIWNLRKIPLPEQESQAAMRARTEQAEHYYEIIQRGAADLSHRKPDFFRDRAEPKLREMSARQERNWARARLNQIENTELMKIGSLPRGKLEKIENEWKQSSAGKTSRKVYPMILTLGHLWLDELIDGIYSSSMFNRFPTPSTICTKLKSFEGEDPKPWQTFQIQQSHIFRVNVGRIQHNFVQIESRQLADYLAVCCEMYPDLRQIILGEYNQIIVPNGDMFHPEYVQVFHESLVERSREISMAGQLTNNLLPSNMEVVLKTLAAIDKEGPCVIDGSCEISYHRPSQMFNITQLHRFVTLNRLVAGVNEASIRCDNFVEVRGQPTLEGNYVPIQMLDVFCRAFDLTITQQPDGRYGSAMHDPSDFSNNSNRIVLAREGLVGYASASRVFGQVTHCPRDEEEFAKYPHINTFLPTMFGDWKVLPKAPNDGRHVYFRPTHWAKYMTADEVETQGENGENLPLVLGVRDPASQCHLAQALHDRRKIIAEAKTPFKPPVSDTDPDGTVAQLQRRSDETRNRGILIHQWNSEANIRRVPPMALDRQLDNLPPVLHDKAVPPLLKSLMKKQFEDGHPDDVSVDSDIRRELAIVDAHHRAEPTELATATVDRNPPSSTVLGRDGAERADGSLPFDIPYDETSVYSRTRSLPLPIRTMDNRSFNSYSSSNSFSPFSGFSLQGAPPRVSKSRKGSNRLTTSFSGGQLNSRPLGITIREHQRARMTPFELENLYKEERRRQVALERVDEADEDMPDTDGPSVVHLPESIG